MYNRYIRGESGAYTRIPEEERRTSPAPPGSTQSSRQEDTAGRQEEHSRSEDHDRVSDGLTGMLRHFLDQLHLDTWTPEICSCWDCSSFCSGKTPMRSCWYLWACC